MRPQWPVSLKGLFTDNHPSLLLPRPTTKAINVSLAVSYIYKLHPPQARRPLGADSLTPDWERMVSFGRGTNAIPARAGCLHSGVMDSEAADTVPISPSCPVPRGRTVIARLHPPAAAAAAAAPYMAHQGEKKREKNESSLGGNAFFVFR